ncbi:MAG: hypothetical protein JO112_16995 [Planctomycetes bacterium]|nr:hypothetical protein [Planctomycetota bacterium]
MAVVSLSSIKRLWPAGWPRNAPSHPFAVTCACGHVNQGQRRPQFQAIPCGGCRRLVFVLPSSPLPPVLESEDPSSVAPGHEISRTWRKRLWFSAAGGLVVVLGFIGWAIWFRLHTATPPPADETPTMVRRIEEGRQALGQGKFQLAAEELATAQRWQEGHPEKLSLAQGRQLAQAYRQAALLTDLSPCSLEEIVQNAAEATDQEEEEWQAEFSGRYRNKGVVFDAEVRRDAAGAYQFGWDLFTRGGKAQIALADLQMLQDLPLQQPQRLLFGARLASVRLETGGHWTVHFVPDSGVLLTDSGAVIALQQGRALDEALLKVLKRQNDWVAARP